MIMVLNKTECLDTLLADLIDHNIRGATIIDSTGMAKAAEDFEILDFFSSFNMNSGQERRSNKTLFLALEDDKIQTAIDIIDSAVGGIENPDTCFLMVLPLLLVKGSYKYHDELPERKEKKWGKHSKELSE